MRLLRCNECTAKIFIERVREKVEGAEIGVPLDLTVSRNGQPEKFSFTPQTR